MLDLTKSYEFFQPEKDDAMIHIIGCGSIGSTVAESLARCGVMRMTLWDFDVVEPHNIVNQMFRQKDVGRLKVDALVEIIKEINPDIEIILKPKGWNGNNLSGYIFLCVDNIEIRKKIVEKNMHNPYIKAMFDFRTRLEDAQHYAADWGDTKMKQDFLNSMNFSHEEAEKETPVSACGISLSVCPTIRAIVSMGVSNFMNFWNQKTLRKLILVDAFGHSVDAF